MTPADEDALIDRVYADWIAGCDSGAKPVSELVRLAIRAAVAAERERCAKWHDEQAAEAADTAQEAQNKRLEYTARQFQIEAETHANSAAAIRRG